MYQQNYYIHITMNGLKLRVMKLMPELQILHKVNWATLFKENALKKTRTINPGNQVQF